MSIVLSHKILKNYLICYGSENEFWLCHAEDRNHAVKQFDGAGMDGAVNEVFECVPATNRYFVRQRRAMWVCFVQEVEAQDADAAVKLFRKKFDPQHSFIEEAVERVDHGPASVFSRGEYSSAQDVAEAD